MDLIKVPLFLVRPFFPVLLATNGVVTIFWPIFLTVRFAFLVWFGLQADDKILHKTCLKCEICHNTLSLGKFAALNGKVRVMIYAQFSFVS
jgi:hypothetical protein